MTDSDYPWEVIPDPSGGYTICFPDLPGCMTCVENLYHVNSTAAEIRDLWLATAREAGMAIPEPGSYEAKGKNMRRENRQLRKLRVACEVYFRRDANSGKFYAPAGFTQSPASQNALGVIDRLLGGQDDD